MLCRTFFVFVVVCLAAGPSRGEVGRYELSLRLRAFESALERQKDEAARRRTTPFLKDAVQSFFALKMDAAAQQLDRARLALNSPETPSAAETWATSLLLNLQRRLVDITTDDVAFSLSAAYPVDVAAPSQASLELIVKTESGEIVAREVSEISSLPTRDRLQLKGVPAGDLNVVRVIVIGEQRFEFRGQTLSRVDGLNERLERLRKQVAELSSQTSGTQTASLAYQLSMLNSLAEGQSLETDIPANEVLTTAESAVTGLTAGRDYFGGQRTGQFWLKLSDGKAGVEARLFAPESVRNGRPLPLVIAMHGAGGSENMFFDGYGDGKIVRLCADRGWLLVAPRVGPLGMGLKIDPFLAAVEELYKVDHERVFVVGHSMGAARAVTDSQLTSLPFAAVAALGGGGRVTQPQKLAKTAFMVGIGIEDFAYARARELHRMLQAAKVREVRYLELPDVEHLAIVQLALEQVFAFFDECANSNQ